MLYKSKGNERGLLRHPGAMIYLFIAIYSSSLLFVISICSSMIPFEFSFGSSVSRETPNFPLFYAEKGKALGLLL